MRHDLAPLCVGHGNRQPNDGWIDRNLHAASACLVDQAKRTSEEIGYEERALRCASRFAAYDAFGHEPRRVGGDRGKVVNRVDRLRIDLPLLNDVASLHRYEEAVVIDRELVWISADNPHKSRRNISLDISIGGLGRVRCVARPALVSFVLVGHEDVLELAVWSFFWDIQATDVDEENIVLNVAKLDLERAVDRVEWA